MAFIDEFIALGDIITSVGISALIGLVDRVLYTDPGIVNTVSSIVTVESRHVGGRVPNPAPFDTGISSIWAYNLALPFIVPGSCLTELSLPILPTLTVLAPTTADNRSSAATGIASSIAPYQNTITSLAIAANTTVVPLEMAFSWDPIQIPFVFEQRK